MYFLQNPMIAMLLSLAFILLCFFVVILILRAIFRSKHKLPKEAHPVVLKILLPKESANKDGAQQTYEQIKEQISWAESLWAQIGGLKPDKGIKTWLYGRFDVLSLELVAREGEIFFYVILPKKLQLYFEQQMQAQYPHAHIEEEDDYNFFHPKSAVKASTLKFTRHNVFPIKTYKNLDSDPLNALTNALSKIQKTEGGAIQVLIRPVKEGWRSYGKKVASEMQQGKSMKEVLAGKKVNPWGVLRSVFDNKQDDKQDLGGNYRLSPKEEEVVKNIEEKISKAGLESQIRVVVASETEHSAEMSLKNLLNSFAQYNIYEFGNSFKIGSKKTDKVTDNFIHRVFTKKNSFILNTEELASIYHFPLPSCETPNIKWLGARKAPAPHNMPQEGVILGKNIYRGKETLVRMNPEDRMRHSYIIGMTGTGKSTLAINMMVQDIKEGKGCCYVDPHGEAIEDISQAIPADRLDDVIYFNPADTERPMGLNMLEVSTPEEADFAAQEMINIFYSLLPDPSMAGPMFEHYMRNALLLLMADTDNPGTLVELPRIFTDDNYRKEKLKHVQDIMVRDFWEREYEQSQKGQMGADMLGYVISKVGRFIENGMLRNIIGQQRSCFDFRKVMDEGKILLVNLSKGKVGDTNSNLLGLITVSKIQMGAMARADMAAEDRKDFFLYIDEFQNFITESISIILSEARKYRLSLCLAHQFIGQLVKNNDTATKDAIFGNVGSMFCFRIGAEDAEFMAKQFGPVFNEHDLMNIEKFNCYGRMMVNNQAAKPFNVATLAPVQGDKENGRKIAEATRMKYGRDRAEVEAEIKERSNIGGEEEKKEEKNDIADFF